MSRLEGRTSPHHDVAQPACDRVLTAAMALEGLSPSWSKDCATAPQGEGLSTSRMGP